MASKRRKGKVEIVQNLAEKAEIVLSSVEDSLPITKSLLSTKPHLTTEKKDKISECLKELRSFTGDLTENILTLDQEGQEIHIKIMFAITTFLNTILDFEDYSHSVDFRAIITNTVFFLLEHSSIKFDEKLKNHIALFVLRFLDLAEFDDIELYIGKVTLNYFLDLTLVNVGDEKSVRKVDVKHVWSMHKCLEAINLLDSKNSELLDKLMSTVTSANFLKFKEGHNLIGYLMSRNVIFAIKVHEIIIKNTPKISKPLASGYGDAYFYGWTQAKQDDIKEAIEKNIQDIMLKVIKISRAHLEMPKSGVNGLAILSVLHRSRKHKNFSYVINKLYTPIIWRNLRSSDPWHRCNAAQVFLDVFPLEKPYLSEVDNADYMERQMKEIKDLLLDDSHFVRIIAIKGVCTHLTWSLELFSVVHVKAILKILLEDLARDGSTYLVRKAVFEGLEMMLNGSPNVGKEAPIESAIILEPLLPLMYLSIHDENEKVRRAVVKMLLKLKEKSESTRLRYWEVVPLKHLVIRLAYEGPVVGDLLVKLVMSEFYEKGQSTDKTINRLIRMMNWNMSSIKNLFRFSKKVLEIDQVFMLIVTLVGIVRKKLKDYLDSQNEIENQKKPETGRKKRRKGSLEDLSNLSLESDKSESETGSSSSSPPARTPCQVNSEFLKNHKVIAGLINGATVLWVTFRNELSEKKEYMDNLYSLACASIPMFLKHYKNTCVYYATVSFASLIPISKLRGVSTVSSACISELKEITDETDETKLQCLIYSLCSWYRGHDVLDLASEWLNYAFREQNLNNSAIPVKTGHKASKVRFVPIEGKPMLSLKLLDILFSDILNETRLVSKNYEQLYEFFSCLERVTVIIERKVEGKEYFKPDTQLTDEFLSKAYARYLRMMHALHRPDPPPDSNSVPFSATSSTLQAINWASNSLSKHIPLAGGFNKPPLAACCCLSVLKEATLSIALGYTDQVHVQSVALFASDLLNFDCPWFIEEVIETIKILSDYAADETTNDEILLFRNILPSLLEKTLNIFSNLDITPTTVQQYFTNLPVMKKDLFALPKTILYVYGAKHPYFIDTFRMYVNACINMAVQEINKEDELVLCKTFDEHPYFVSFILRHILVVSNFAKHIFPSLLYYTNFYREEGYKLLGCLSLLYTVGFNVKNKFDDLQLELYVQQAYQAFENYDEKESEKNKNSDESSFSTSSINIDIKNVGENLFTELSQHLHCSLRLPALSTNEFPITPKSSRANISFRKTASIILQPEISLDRVPTPTDEFERNLTESDTPAQLISNDRLKIPISASKKKSNKPSCTPSLEVGKNIRTTPVSTPDSYFTPSPQPSTSKNISNLEMNPTKSGTPEPSTSNDGFLKPPTPPMKKKSSKRSCTQSPNVGKDPKTTPVSNKQRTSDSFSTDSSYFTPSPQPSTSKACPQDK